MKTLLMNLLRQTNEIVYNLAQTTTLSVSFQIFVGISHCTEHILINEMLLVFS